MSFALVPEVAAADHVLGPSQAPVTVVEYGDFECPTCKQAALAVKIMLARFAGSTRFVYRHFPLVGVHPHALQAAFAAEAAAAQGKFWPMHDLLFANQGYHKPRDLHCYAARLDLDVERFDAEVAGALYLQRVRSHIESGERRGVRGTPGFFINGVVQDVSFGMEQLLKGVEAALKR